MAAQEPQDRLPLTPLERRVLEQVLGKMISCPMITEALAVEGYSRQGINQAVKALERRGLMLCQPGAVYEVTALGEEAVGSQE